MATTPATSTSEPHRETREQDKAAKQSQIIVVDLDDPQPSERVRRLRKGKGKLFTKVERIVKDLVDDGTVKASAQPIVIVVREMPSPPWAFDDDD
jgi:hypothetical protein